MEYGEGVIRMDKATAYMIRTIRFCKRQWGLSHEGVKIAMERAVEAESGTSFRGVLPTTRALKTREPTNVQKQDTPNAAASSREPDEN